MSLYPKGLVYGLADLVLPAPPGESLLVAALCGHQSLDYNNNDNKKEEES